MKKLLPLRLTSLAQGFTLVELMVVIAVIAILSVMGISIYANVQKNARDGVRRAEIASLAKSIETAKDPTVSTYTYTATNYGADYPQSKPADPLKSSSSPYYCVATGISASPARPTIPPAAWGTNCPSDAVTLTTSAWSTLVDSASAYQAASVLSAVKYWAICAKLENGNSYCVASNSP